MEKTQAHTPGPWAVTPSSNPKNGTAWRDIVSHGTTFAPSYVGEAMECDAYLIAAAPDLLEALQDVQKSVMAQHGETFMRDYTYTVEISGETIGVIVRAIAKAKGGAA